MWRHLVCLFCLFITCGKGQILNLHEGSSCTWNGVSGQCVSIYKCLSTFIDIRDKQYAPICTYRDTEPIICCTDCKLTNDTRNLIFDPQLGILEKTGSKAQQKCIEFINTIDYPCKIFKRAVMRRTFNKEDHCNDIAVHVKELPYGGAVGGTDAYREQFPHMALLGYGTDINSADWLCGGSVISERFILTAGHCLSSPAVGKVKYIALGILKRTDPSELWRTYNVKRIIVHPEYKAPSKYHDIVLLETDKPIAFDYQVRPACLHTEGEAQEVVTATGWGALGYRSQLADTLQAVSVSRFNEDECSRFYPPHRHLKRGYNHTTQMCYGDKFVPKDTCEGDSGGPLQSSNYGNGCTYTILGVTSYGRQCGIGGGSGMYTRVFHYVPWIESVVWP